jgi:hypothetical protein
MIEQTLIKGLGAIIGLCVTYWTTRKELEVTSEQLKLDRDILRILTEAKASQ